MINSPEIFSNACGTPKANDIEPKVNSSLDSCISEEIILFITT
jgi:hypothetical protein